jgi:DNA mismatch repair protein MutS
MVEMQEISYILHHATKKSFIIIDEIGRGTSTYDGMSLAWSILKYITIQSQSRGLFATHYHEIIDHVSELVGVSNYSVAVSENEENIVFLRKIIP